MTLESPTWHLKVGCPCCGQGHPLLICCPSCEYVAATCEEVDGYFLNPRDLVGDLSHGRTDRCPACGIRSLEEFIPASDGEFRLQTPIEGLSPEAALQNKQLREALDAAINRLPKKYKMVLVLRDMEGLSAKEVGAIMGLNERAVKSRLHRARLFVRRELSARGLGEAPSDHDTLG